MRKVVLLLMAALSGCGSGIGYVAQNYGVQVGETIRTKDGEFKVWDHPADGKMLVSPTLAEVLSHPKAMNYGIATEGGPEEAAARGAAASWFERQGRRCEIASTREAAHPEFEFTYRCL